MLIGSLFSFGFTIVSSMILSRFLDKGDYGTFKQVIYVYSTLLTVFTLGLPKAFSYYLPRVNLNEVKDLIKKITNLFYLLGGVFSILLFVFSTLFSQFLNNPDLSLALKIFSPVPLLMLPCMGLESILATFRKTQFIAFYVISTRLFSLLCLVVPVLIFNGTYIHALIGFVVASALNFILAIYLKFLPVRNEKTDSCNISYNEIFKYSLPLLNASLWGMLISSSDQFFISRYFGKENFADFSNGSLELPFVSMIVGAGSTVLSPIFSKKIFEKGNIKTDILPLWLSVFEKTAKLIYPLVIFFFFYSHSIMILLYGKVYENSGSYFQIKLIVNFFTLISYAPLIMAIGATKFYSKTHMYGALILIGLEYISIITFNSPYIITIISVICQIGRILALLFFLSNFFQIRFVELFPLKLIFKILIISITLIISIQFFFISILGIAGIVSIVVSFLVYIILYLISCQYAKIDNFSIITPLVSKFRK